MTKMWQIKAVMNNEYDDIYKNPEIIPVIYDVDGHLLDTESEQYFYYRTVLLDFFAGNEEAKARVKEKLPVGEAGRVWYMHNLMGHPKEHYLILSEEFAPVSPEETEEIDARVYKEIFAAISPKSVFPKVKEMLWATKQDKACKVYFVSGGSRKAIDYEMANSGLLQYVSTPPQEYIYTREDYRQSKKEVIKEIARKHKADIRLVIISGDGIRDMAASRDINGGNAYAIGNLGMLGNSDNKEIKARQTEALYAAGADKVVENSVELWRAVLAKIQENKRVIRAENANRPTLAVLMAWLEKGRLR